MRSLYRLLALGALTFVLGCDQPTAPVKPAGDAAEQYDIVIRGGTIYDGSGSAPYVGDLAIRDDRIAAICDVGNVPARQTVDAAGMAVSPGFINMMSHSQVTLQVDGAGHHLCPVSRRRHADDQFDLARRADPPPSDYSESFQRDWPMIDVEIERNAGGDAVAVVVSSERARNVRLGRLMDSGP